MIRFWDKDIDFSDILLDKKLYKENNKNILSYEISYKTSTGAKPLGIWLNKIDGFIKIYNKIRYLVLFDYSYCDKIFDRAKYLIRFNSYNSLPLWKVLTFHNAFFTIHQVSCW